MSLYSLLINEFEVTDDLSVLIRDIGTKEIWKEMESKSWSGKTEYTTCIKQSPTRSKLKMWIFLFQQLGLLINLAY